MSDFRTDRKMTRAGRTWYCQTPGIRWETAPDGWQLYLTDGPSWHLFGLGEHIGVEVSLGTTRLKEAMDSAVEEIVKREPGERFPLPTGGVSWITYSMDEGVLRVAATRQEIVKWACNRHGGEVVSRKNRGAGRYDYHIGSSRTDSRLVWVVRSDSAHLDGVDPEQEPWYPYPEAPALEGPRAQRTLAERFGE